MRVTVRVRVQVRMRSRVRVRGLTHQPLGLRKSWRKVLSFYQDVFPSGHQHRVRVKVKVRARVRYTDLDSSIGLSGKRFRAASMHSVARENSALSAC